MSNSVKNSKKSKAKPAATNSNAVPEATGSLSASRLSAANPVDSKALDEMSTQERIDLYLKTLNNEDLSKIDQDKVLEMRKKLNPYGRTIAGADEFMNFSITQITHEYWKKLITTAMIGYLNRMCDEWKVPSGVPVVSVYEFIDNPKLVDTPALAFEKNNQRSIEDYAFNREWMKKRLVVKEFLEEMFQFNPDEHVRSAYRPNYKDESRKPLDTMAARIAVRHACHKDATLRADKALHDSIQGIKTKKVKRTIRGRDGKVREVIREVAIQDPPAPPAPTSRDPLDPAHPVDPSVVSTVTNMIPPHDLFGRFKMYLTENYEELREAVLALYCEKPEFELAINPYGNYKTREQAEAFKKQHSDEVIAEVFTAETGKWNFFDSFKKQRESVNFYNKNTIILEEMVKQIERDERLGQDLMSKRVEKEKAKNVMEAGPDAANFKQWVSENSELTKMGAKYIGDMAGDDVGEDSIEIPVWKVAKGGLELTRDRFQSKAEAPSFVAEAHAAASAGVDPRADNL
jgi:hypothetical protein